MMKTDLIFWIGSTLVMLQTEYVPGAKTKKYYCMCPSQRELTHLSYKTKLAASKGVREYIMKTKKLNPCSPGCPHSVA